MGLGVKGGDTVEIVVTGDDAENAADSLIHTLTKGE